MKKAFATIVAFIAVFDSGLAYGQAWEPFSKWRIDASLPLQYATNVLLAPVNTRADAYMSPSVKLSAIGEFDPTLSYQIYMATNPDAHANVRAADDAALTVGTRLNKAFGNFSAGGIFNHVLPFDGIYRSVLFQANDFSGYVGSQYDNKPAGFSIASSAMTTYRLADISSQSRFLFTVKADITQKLSEKWSFTVTPTLRYYAFTEGTAAGKRNIFPSLVGALTYKINKDLSLAGSVEYDRRWSNRIGSDFSNVVFLASINFGHEFLLNNGSALRRLK